MKKYLFIIFFLIANFKLQTSNCFAQQSSLLDATYIADNYYNGIVKILLYDSIAEKTQPGSGYIGRGSGFIVTEDGLIFTNRHVVEYCVFGYMDYIHNDAATYEELRTVSIYSENKIYEPATKKVNRTGYTAPIVQIYSGRGENDYKLYYAKVIAMDVGAFDGAILKIVSEANGNPVTEKFHPVPVGNSDSTRQGEDLCIYGFPAQFDAGLSLTLQDMSTLTFGKHSGFDYVFNKDYGYIKTDASINNGNSGGPVFNSDNKVIGIATATGNKTNIGLVGGINGMYTIAKSDEKLLSELKKTGLKPSPAKATAGSAIVTGAKRPIMGQKKLKSLASDKFNERKFQNGTFYIKTLYSPSAGNYFSINSSSNFPVSNPDEFVSVSETEGGIEFGYVFPVWRATSHFKMSFDYTFIGATYYQSVFDKIKISDTIDIISGSYPKKDHAYFYMKFAPVVSGLIFKRVVLDAYYKAAPTFCLFADGFMQFYTDSAKEKFAEFSAEPKLALFHSIGFNLRYKVFTIGMEYCTGKIKSFDVFYNPPDSNTNELGTGALNRETLFITLGVGFGGKVD